MRLSRRPQVVLLAALMLLCAALTWAQHPQDPQDAQVKSEKRVTPKPPPPPIAPVPKKPRPSDEAEKDKDKVKPEAKPTPEN